MWFIEMLEFIVACVPHRGFGPHEASQREHQTASSEQPEHHGGKITTLSFCCCFFKSHIVFQRLLFTEENKSKVLLQMSFACAVELPAVTLTHFKVDVAETLCSISSCLWLRICAFRVMTELLIFRFVAVSQV